MYAGHRSSSDDAARGVRRRLYAARSRPERVVVGHARHVSSSRECDATAAATAELGDVASRRSVNVTGLMARCVTVCGEGRCGSVVSIMVRVAVVAVVVWCTHTNTRTHTRTHPHTYITHATHTHAVIVGGEATGDRRGDKIYTPRAAPGM